MNNFFRRIALLLVFSLVFLMSPFATCVNAVETEEDEFIYVYVDGDEVISVTGEEARQAFEQDAAQFDNGMDDPAADGEVYDEDADLLDAEDDIDQVDDGDDLIDDDDADDQDGADADDQDGEIDGQPGDVGADQSGDGEEAEVLDLQLFSVDEIGLMTGKTYGEKPVLNNNFMIAEFFLYQLYTGQGGQFTFLTPGAVKDPKNIIELAYTYYPHPFGISLASSKKDGYKEWTASINYMYPGLIAAEREFAEDYVVTNIKNQNMSTEQIVKKIHDDIAQWTTYDTEGYKNKNYACEHNGQLAYCALVENKAVCAGYANAFALLCNYAGVSAAGVNGKVTGVGQHRWNVVYEEDGVLRLVDVTWDDQEENGIIDDYFWKTYSELDSTYKRTWNQDQDSFINYLNAQINASSVGTLDPVAYTLYGFNEGGSKTDDFRINMVTEEIYLAEAASYVVSTDGGAKWKKLASTSAGKLFGNKTVNLIIAQTSDNKTPVSGTKISFGQIEARPKIGKPNYLECDKDRFCLIDANGDVQKSLIYIASDYKSLTIYDYKNFPEEGIAVTPIKAKLSVAISPVLDDVNGKVTPRSALKSYTIVQRNAPKVKINYKTETMKLKAGMIYRIDKENGTWEEADWSEPVTAAEAKTPIDVSDQITNLRSFEFYLDATDKKPSSLTYKLTPNYSSDKKQGASILPRAGELTKAYVLDTIEKDSKGKYVCSDKTLEFKAPNATKWGKLPTAKTSGLSCRVKATKTNAASLPIDVDMPDIP